MNKTILIVNFLILPFLADSQKTLQSFNYCEELEINGIGSAHSFELDHFTTKSLNTTIQLNLQLEGKSVMIVLEELNIYSDNYSTSVKADKSEENFYNPRARHYVGKISSDDQSRVTINLRDSRITGVVRTKKKIWNIAYSNELKKQYIFDHSKTDKDYSFNCQTIDADKYSDNIIQNFTKSSTSCSNAVNVYFECDYDMFLNFNSDTAQLIDYVTDLFTEVNALYGSEDLNVLISQITVWTDPDPYTDGTDGVYDFENELNNTGFNGDLAQLLTNDADDNGGIAYTDQLCGNSPYAYCDLTNAFELYPAYSWDLQVIAHELGHQFGSQHTHDCVWGPNGNEQIDDCGNVHTSDDGLCFDPMNPIIPPQGGTVMSYCHLDPVGINFINGFGTEPGDLIRAKHASCFCDNPTCSTAMELSVSGTYIAKPDHGSGASNPNATHADWFYFIPDSDGSISINSCGETEDTRLWVWEGSCDELSFLTVSDDDCDSGNGNYYASEILDLPVNAGLIYYIEWDDRWSNNEFDWIFEFVPEIVLDPCDDMNISIGGMVQDTVLNAKHIIDSDSYILPGNSVVFKAGESIELKCGFEIPAGASFEANLEDCQD